MLTLYDFGNSVCCQKVRITMHAKGLTWESVRVDLFKAEQYEPKYLKLNSKGVVLTLVKDRPRVKGWWKRSGLMERWASYCPRCLFLRISHTSSSPVCFPISNRSFMLDRDHPQAPRTLSSGMLNSAV
jgi:hypothetical protein